MKTSPEAIAVASFTFLVAILLGGWQQVTLLTARLFGQYVPGMGGGAEITGAVVVVLLTAGALVMSRRVGPLGATWAAHLAGATTILGALVIIAGVVSILASLLNSY